MTDSVHGIEDIAGPGDTPCRHPLGQDGFCRLKKYHGGVCSPNTFETFRETFDRPTFAGYDPAPIRKMLRRKPIRKIDPIGEPGSCTAAPAGWACTLHFLHPGPCRPVQLKLPGLEIQTAPWHYRWDRSHNPRRCLLCWVERIAVALRFAHYEPDPAFGIDELEVMDG